MKKLVYVVITLFIAFLFTGCGNTQPYPETVKSWKSHEDVAKWMKSNWSMDNSTRLRLVRNIKKMRSSGADMSTITAASISMLPEESYNKAKGHCADAAVLIKDSLNKINPEYNAKIIFIMNVYGPPNHWVTGFYIKDELYIMDFGAGKHWSDMMGIHGPYKSLDGYATFLENVDAKNFKLDFVEWRDYSQSYSN